MRKFRLIELIIWIIAIVLTVLKYKSGDANILFNYICIATALILHIILDMIQGK